jgi:TonB family protein
VPAATPEPVRASSATDAEEAKTPAAATRTNAPATAAFLVPVEQPRPAFPAEAVRQGIEQGRVRARLHVSEDGRVGKVEIVESLPRRLFDRAVLGAAGQWRYAPPGQPQAVDVEFVFRRDG